MRRRLGPLVEVPEEMLAAEAAAAAMVDRMVEIRSRNWAAEEVKSYRRCPLMLLYWMSGYEFPFFLSTLTFVLGFNNVLKLASISCRE